MPERMNEAECPKCRRPMALKDRKAVLFSRGLDSETYRCEACGGETVLTSRPEEMRLPDVAS
jgi:hypothetical protein